MKEKDFQRKFSRWCSQNGFSDTAAFELKLTKTGSIPFSALAEHQKEALSRAKHGHLHFKIPDVGYQNPFDSLVVVKIMAFVVVMYYERGCKEFFMIDIDAWIEEESVSKRKSLTKNRALHVGERHYLGC